jgi:hypothetical protein
MPNGEKSLHHTFIWFVDIVTISNALFANLAFRFFFECLFVLFF